ncbi:hypothetical protein, partial [Paenibacillus popilliae]|uniref:hypothetical protein n=1 Tax=Paenibacillus popilliae TaxID=78057 RepID=UPI001F18964A
CKLVSILNPSFRMRDGFIVTVLTCYAQVGLVLLNNGLHPPWRFSVVVDYVCCDVFRTGLEQNFGHNQ